MISHQATFDLVLRKIRKQGKPSVIIVDGLSYCQYRGPDGLKCAAGMLIPDADYSPSFESKGCDFKPIAECLTKCGFDLKLLNELQIAHDMASSINEQIDPDFMEKFEKNMFAVATKYNLSYLRGETTTV